MSYRFVPVVPESLQSFADSSFYDESARLASMPLDTYTSRMPDLQSYNRYKDTPAIRAASYEPADYDPKHAVFSLNPFGNGHEPHMDIRNRVAQAVAAPNTRYVAFPNNTARDTYYTLNKKQLATVARGDVTPVAEAIHNAAEEMGLESVDLLGYSQGALIGVAFMKLAQQRGIIEVKNALIAEPANVTGRSEKQLKKAVMGTGLLPLVRAVKDSAIPALEEAQAMRGLRDWPRLTRGMMSAMKGSKVPENKALHSAMTHGTFADDVVALGPRDSTSRSRITLMRAEQSKVTTATNEFLMLTIFRVDEYLETEGYGHEAADNVTGVYALLAKAALSVY